MLLIRKVWSFGCRQCACERKSQVEFKRSSMPWNFGCASWLLQQQANSSAVKGSEEDIQGYAAPEAMLLSLSLYCTTKCNPKHTSMTRLKGFDSVRWCLLFGRFGSKGWCIRCSLHKRITACCHRHSHKSWKMIQD